MAWGDLRLPGQSLEYREHPSDVGSPSYFADTGRGWVPSPVTPNRPATVPSNRQPGFEFANRNVAPNAFGYDRAGPSRGDISPFVSNQANIERANRGIATIPDEDEGMGMIGHAKQALSGMKWPSLPRYAGMMAESVGKNQAQHKDLDQYFQSGYGDDWRKAKNVSFWQEQGFGSASKNQNINLLSGQGRQARGYFNRAGITDRSFDTFMDPNSKWFGNEAWLRSQADGDKSELVDTGMSFIKNAKDTAGLHRSVFGQRDMRDYEEGEHWDIAPDAGFAPGYDQELPAYSDEPFRLDQRYSTAPGGIDEGEFAPGYDQELPAYSDEPFRLDQGPGPWNEFDPYNTSMVPKNVGKYGKSTLEEKQVFNDLYDFQKGEFIGPRGFKPKLGLMKDRPYDADEIFDEDEIIPNIADLDYFNQYR